MKNARLKIVWFSPLPPQRGRVAECSTRMLSGVVDEVITPERDRVD
ncbi:MAG: hypothetical protein KKB90_03265 [Actinobacteria bacterium]|nr:hypothetical protein [Actinomycetota bacterium]MCG2817481.1 hypothetical protein [Actinomycetes bacterium]MBU4217965.1 hypothetical protein [Actinomycetota bacterium]MBU4357921.1 hypothetical protein [Actinomycetota bacterium]MBU4393028.1 hypothetical protein [Actinomycetota bacterium]